MKAATRHFSERLHGPARLYGTLIVSPSPHWVPVVAGLGLDFVFIDTEHIPIDREKLAWMCQTYRAVGLPPIVRIPAPRMAELTGVRWEIYGDPTPDPADTEATVVHLLK